MNKEQIQLMQKAAAAITQLRNVNREQAIRLQMFDDMMLLLRTQSPSYGMNSSGTDIVAMLEQAAAQAEEENK